VTGSRVDIIVDNAGFELVTDLLLADFLCSSGVASRVVFQLKAHPTFVSDARISDFCEHVATLAALDPTGPHAGCAALGGRWAAHLATGRWALQEHAFWVQPSPTWELPPDLRDELKGASMAFSKGDANYRRLLGDRNWNLDAPFADVVSSAILGGSLRMALQHALLKRNFESFTTDCMCDCLRSLCL
jgi:hypothetical protein